MSLNTQNLHVLEISLNDFAEKVGLAPAVVAKRITLDLHNRVTLRTPVDTGRARASWDVKQGSPSDYTPPIQIGSAKKKGKTKLGTGQAGNALGSGAAQGGNAKDVSGEIASIDGNRVIFITSNLEYIQYLEQGSSKQAPAGMVRLSLAEVEIELESIIDQL